jgi:hypothetical protein
MKMNAGINLKVLKGAAMGAIAGAITAMGLMAAAEMHNDGNSDVTRGTVATLTFFAMLMGSEAGMLAALKNPMEAVAGASAPRI